MSTLEKVLVAIVGVAALTTAVLPKRQTPAVINAAGTSLSKVIGVSMGTITKV